MMSLHDLLGVLPNYKPLIHSLEQSGLTVADIVSLEPAEIARKGLWPLLDISRFASEVIRWLQADLNMLSSSGPAASMHAVGRSQQPEVGFVRTLDPDIDAVLGGGFATGYMSEVVGESGVGKTQLLYGLLLSVQLKPPYGLGKSAIYISTEGALKPIRLIEILNSHPEYANLSAEEKPSTDHIHTVTINSLETQQNLVEYKVPQVVEDHNVGLIIIDSVTANFRAETETSSAARLADRSSELIRLGGFLRSLARKNNLAVVVANQVSDRFSESLLQPTQDMLRSSSSSSPALPSTQLAERNAKMTLDHQQRFFTGWGDKPNDQLHNPKTPALGLSWATQLDARVCCHCDEVKAKENDTFPARRRFLNTVFAPWTDQKSQPVEFTLEAHGVAAKKRDPKQQELEELLDDSLWQDADDEEFP